MGVKGPAGRGGGDGQLKFLVSDCPPYMEIWVYLALYRGRTSMNYFVAVYIVHGLPSATNSTSEKGGTEEGGYCILYL
jgi:hypothetical protein